MSDPVILEIIKGFVIEAQDLTQRITRAVLRLERPGPGAATAAAYDDLCRALHTLKGAAGTLGFTDLSDAAHRIEDAMAVRRERLEPLPAALADAIFQSLDVLNLRAEAYAQERTDGLPDLAGPLERLQAALDGMPAPRAEAGSTAGPEAPAPAAPKEAAAADPGEWRVGQASVRQVIREVERLRELQLRLGERRRDMDRGLSILSRLGMLAETAEARAVLMSVSRTLADDTDEAASIVEALEEGVREITTMPVRTVLEPLHRAVRDLCRQLGKEARLSVVGAELSLDRRMLEALRGPLVHLVRNAVDHGVEMPEAREAAGKHREGSVVIRLEQVGNLAFIEVSDDGRGLDEVRIGEVAEAQGVLGAGEARGLTPHQLHQLAFRPHFSTRPEVSETSGRGVGLDVVQSEVHALGGRVEAHSSTGQGTRFTLTVPMELGSSPVLIVRCGEHSLGLPTMAVEQVRPARQGELRITRAGMHLVVNEQLLPLLDLGSLLGIRQPTAPHPGTPVAVVQAQGRRVGVSFDEVMGDRDLVIRPLPRELRSLDAYQGEAIYVHGELILVLRPDWLVQGGASRGRVAVQARRALVVDDSLTARAMHRSMLEAHGFTVHTAGNGSQALEQLRHSTYDVMIADIGMEGMDGYQLTRAVRGAQDTRQMPVVLVSAQDGADERQAGIEAGADGFLSKKECAAGRLLQEVQAVIGRREGAPVKKESV
ncbi:MAG TPA: response regulator [Myxococcaceae bacterium]